MNTSRLLPWLLCGAAVLSSKAAAPASDHPASALQVTSATPGVDLWQSGVGSGFRRTVQSLTVESGASLGFAAFGGRLRHDLALLSLTYGHMLGSVKGQGHWYRGNWELRGELFTGAEFSPARTWGIGLTPHLRYQLATGTRWVPFADLGAGVTATGEQPPDLGGAFEFNLQAGTGLQWFVRDNLALTFEARYLHVSSAGLYQPNLGLNTIAGLVGLTWYY